MSLMFTMQTVMDCHKINFDLLLGTYPNLTLWLQ